MVTSAGSNQRTPVLRIDDRINPRPVRAPRRSQGSTSATVEGRSAILSLCGGSVFGTEALSSTAITVPRTSTLQIVSAL